MKADSLPILTSPIIFPTVRGRLFLTPAATEFRPVMLLRRGRCLCRLLLWQIFQPRRAYVVSGGLVEALGTYPF